MAWHIWLAVALGGSVGAMGRHGVALLLAPTRDGAIPWQTLTVNVVGSLLLGVLVGLSISGRLGSPALRAFLATGFCGALTTFSTFSVETVSLARAGHYGVAIGYTALNVILCMGVAAVGLTLATRA